MKRNYDDHYDLLKTTKKTRVAVFGGSFNPPHFGHQSVIAWLLSTKQVDSVWMVPCFRHMFGKRLAPFKDRFAMCEMTAALFRQCTANSVEGNLKGRSLMLRTIQFLKNYHIYKNMEFSLVIGMDNWLVRDKWEGFDQLQKECRIIVVGGDAQPWMPNIRSTMIRNMLVSGEDVSSLLPAGVLSYIKKKNLYLPKK